MDEVYRARDGGLEREVAIKVLPASSSSDPERLKRSEREAQLPASLDTQVKEIQTRPLSVVLAEDTGLTR